MAKKIVVHNGLTYHLVMSTKDFRDKEPKPIAEVITKSDLGLVMEMAFKKVKHDR